MMGLIRLQIFILIVLSSSLYTILYVNGNSAEQELEQDTSLFDWVAFNLLDDYVDLLEMTAWFGRRVKDHIDELVDNSFMLFTKQQDVLDPAIRLADKYNRPDCSEGQIMSVTDAVFKEFFNMNINCPTIGQKMSVFFNELHNITQRVSDIHRRYLHAVPNCAPPVLPRPERACLQNLVDSTKRETGLLRTHMTKLSYDIDEFMDGQVEEAFQCVLKGMSTIRNKTKQAVHDIHFCLDLKDNNYNKKYDSPLVKQVMGNVKRPFDHLEIASAETIKENEANQQPQHHPGMPPPPNVQFHPGQPPPPYPHGIPPPGTHPGHYPGMNPQFYPGMHPQHPGFPNPQQHPNFQQPGMTNPQQHPNFQHPGIPNPQQHPNFQQPGMPNPQQHPNFQQPGIPHAQNPHNIQTPEISNPEQPEAFNPQNSEAQESEIPDPDTLPAFGDDSDPPWRLSPDKKPKYARSDYHDDFVLPKFEEGELPQFETGKNNNKNDVNNQVNHEDKPHHEDIKQSSIHNEF